MFKNISYKFIHILIFSLFVPQWSLANFGQMPINKQTNYPVSYHPKGQSLTADIFEEPNPVTTDTRIKTLVYNENEVYKLKFHYGYQSHIEFALDEEIELISIGESFSWKLTPIGRRLFIRPLDVSSHTNMTVVSNKASYEFDFRSGEYDGSSDEELVYKIKFYHPPINPEPKFPNKIAKKSSPARVLPQMPKYDKTPPAQINLDLDEKISGRKKGERLSFDYSMSGESKAIKPLRVYNNGKETFFKFKNSNFIVPKISIVDSYGNEIPTKQKERNGYIVIPEVAKQFTLRMNNELICVFNSVSQEFIRSINQKRTRLSSGKTF
jgi:type IV secretion system protein VirB9